MTFTTPSSRSSSASPSTSRRTVAAELRIVAIPATIALGSIGAIAAERVHLPMVLGFIGGALAAVLTVLALPSLPTRRATVVLLGVGGLGALRHASYSGGSRTTLLALWAVATLVALVLVDRADAETTPALAGGTPLPPRGRETVRNSAFIAVIVIVAAVALVPTVTTRLGRHVWPGLDPTFGDVQDAATSLRSTHQLDMTTRPRLTDKVVFTVDSPRSDFWRGETFDVWDGETWTRSDEDDDPLLDRNLANNVEVKPSIGDVSGETGNELRQTFHLENDFSDVVFAAPSLREVETDKLLRGRPDGTVAVAGGSSGGFGKGAVYTVTSRSLPTTEAQLRAADSSAIDSRILAQYVQGPTESTPRVRALAQQITAKATTAFDKIRAIESWLGHNTKYSLNAPLSPPGVDVVDDFLFRSHLGWCEQIASSLVVMARSVGIPARLTTGFVPGERDALTGRFIVREKDAHAWAEIYFGGIGWQGFDPTASVPLAGDAKPGGSWLTDARRHIVPIAIGFGILILLVGALPELLARSRRRKARRASWSARTQDRLERIGRKAGRRRLPAETPREYAHALAERLSAPGLDDVGAALDQEAFSEHTLPDDARSELDAVLASLRP